MRLFEGTLIGEVQTEAFGQKENMGKVNMGRELSVLTNSVFSAHTDNGLRDYVLFRLNNDWLFVPDEGSCGRSIACAYADVIRQGICLIHLLSRNHPR